MWIIKNLFFKINYRPGEEKIKIRENPIKVILLWSIIIVDVIAGFYCFLFYPFPDYITKFVIGGILFVFAFTTFVFVRTSILWMLYAPCLSVLLLLLLCLRLVLN